MNRNRIPSATYTEPGIGSVGMTEAQARAAGRKVKVGKFPFVANSKATIVGQHDGFVKVVADEQYGEILGVHIIGPAGLRTDRGSGRGHGSRSNRRDADGDNPRPSHAVRSAGRGVQRGLRLGHQCYKCEVRRLGRIEYAKAFEWQRTLVEQRKQERRFRISSCCWSIRTPSRSAATARMENLLASEPALRSAGIAFHASDRGGDITYHGPGQVVGYPILDLRGWKRDVGAYVRAIEQVMIDTLADFGITAGRLAGCTGVWVEGKKIGAIGVHISRWITSHGFALNVNTDLSYFGYIVPCGLTKPVTSMAQLGVDATTSEVHAKLARAFGHEFDREILEPALLEPALEKAS